MKRDSEALKVRTKNFALRVSRRYRSLPRTEEAGFTSAIRPLTSNFSYSFFMASIMT